VLKLQSRLKGPRLILAIFFIGAFPALWGGCPSGGPQSGRSAS